MNCDQDLGQIALFGSDHGSLINQLIPMCERLPYNYELLSPRILNKFLSEINFNFSRKLLGEDGMGSRGKQKVPAVLAPNICVIN